MKIELNKREILLQTEKLRIVGEGVYGWGVVLQLETAHKDALGDIAWHSAGTLRYNCYGEETNEGGITHAALYSTLDKLSEVQNNLRRAKTTIEQRDARIKELEDQLKEAQYEALGDDL